MAVQIKAENVVQSIFMCLFEHFYGIILHYNIRIWPRLRDIKFNYYIGALGNTPEMLHSRPSIGNWWTPSASELLIYALVRAAPRGWKATRAG